MKKKKSDEEKGWGANPPPGWVHNPDHPGEGWVPPWIPPPKGKEEPTVAPENSVLSTIFERGKGPFDR